MATKPSSTRWRPGASSAQAMTRAMVAMGRAPRTRSKSTREPGSTRSGDVMARPTTLASTMTHPEGMGTGPPGAPLTRRFYVAAPRGAREVADTLDADALAQPVARFVVGDRGWRPPAGRGGPRVRGRAAAGDACRSDRAAPGSRPVGARERGGAFL